MIIVLEGPRGTGKTVLAKALVPALIKAGYSTTIAKFERGSSPHDDMIGTVNSLLIESKMYPKNATIIDRFHLTEFVMRTVDGSVPSGKLFADMAQLSLMLQNAGAWVAILHTNEDDRVARVEKRGDGRADEPPAVINAWDYLMATLDGPDRKKIFTNLFYLNTTRRSPESLANMLLLRISIRSSYVHSG